jgi:hypothetical protein
MPHFQHIRVQSCGIVFRKHRGLCLLLRIARQKHRAQNPGHARRSGEESVQLVAQIAAPPCQGRLDRSRECCDFLKDGACAKSCLHVDVLLRQEFAPVERARVLNKQEEAAPP